MGVCARPPAADTKPPGQGEGVRARDAGSWGAGSVLPTPPRWPFLRSAGPQVLLASLLP